jgi:hypothetical protein
MGDSADQPKCAGCGRFIAYDDCDASRYDFTPLNEFGPEEVEWTCPACLAKEREGV